jgi:hypothetical protein
VGTAQRSDGYSSEVWRVHCKGLVGKVQSSSGYSVEVYVSIVQRSGGYCTEVW